ncbi:hypothetical protein GW17_00040100 [Ensete ventricosum]|nr:hypothetical protein GW17_00040100 [Ensete ventricosum]
MVLHVDVGCLCPRAATPTGIAPTGVAPVGEHQFARRRSPVGTMAKSAASASGLSSRRPAYGAVPADCYPCRRPLP